jgi:hypothetical protein
MRAILKMGLMLVWLGAQGMSVWAQGLPSAATMPPVQTVIAAQAEAPMTPPVPERIAGLVERRAGGGLAARSARPDRTRPK